MSSSPVSSPPVSSPPVSSPPVSSPPVSSPPVSSPPVSSPPVSSPPVSSPPVSSPPVSSPPVSSSPVSSPPVSSSPVSSSPVSSSPVFPLRHLLRSSAERRRLLRRIRDRVASTCARRRGGLVGVAVRIRHVARLLGRLVSQRGTRAAWSFCDTPHRNPPRNARSVQVKRVAVYAPATECCRGRGTGVPVVAAHERGWLVVGGCWAKGLSAIGSGSSEFGVAALPA